MSRRRDNGFEQGRSFLRNMLDQQREALFALSSPRLASAAERYCREQLDSAAAIHPSLCELASLDFTRTLTQDYLERQSRLIEPEAVRAMREVARSHALGAQLEKRLLAAGSGFALDGQRTLEELARSSGLLTTAAEHAQTAGFLDVTLNESMARLDGGAAKALEDLLERARGQTLVNLARQTPGALGVDFAGGLDELMRLGAGAQSFRDELMRFDPFQSRYDAYFATFDVAGLYRHLLEEVIQATDDEDLDILCDNLVTENPWRFDEHVLKALRAVFARATPLLRVFLVLVLLPFLANVAGDQVTEWRRAPQEALALEASVAAAAQSEAKQSEFRARVEQRLEQQVRHQQWQQEQARRAELGHLCVVRNAKLRVAPARSSRALVDLRPGDVGLNLGNRGNWRQLRILSRDGGPAVEGFVYRNRVRLHVLGLHEVCSAAHPTASSAPPAP